MFNAYVVNSYHYFNIYVTKYNTNFCDRRPSGVGDAVCASGYVLNNPLPILYPFT